MLIVFYNSLILGRGCSYGMYTVMVWYKGGWLVDSTIWGIRV